MNIRRQIDRLLGENTSPRFEQYEIISESDLSEKEKLVIDCVGNNPGISKEGVVNHLRGKYSRGPVFKAIDSLGRYNMIAVRKDANNHQTHLYINKESLLVSTIEQLENVKNNFFGLINKVKVKQLHEWKDSRDYSFQY